MLTRFDPEGPDRQSFDAVDVEDSHHRLLTIAVERLGTEEIEVPAGRFTTTHYQSERFGTTQHWVDEKGTLIRWASENDSFRWDLTRTPSEEPLPRKTRRLASGAYQVTSSAGGPDGAVPWSLEQDDDAGHFWLFASEELDRRTRLVQYEVTDGDLLPVVP